MKAIIIDDEQNSIESLQWLIRNYAPEIEIARTFTSAIEALDHLRKDEPDVVFIDVEMEEMNGFELLSSLGKFRFHVIFVTAYNNYALDAFKVNALDYLMKPVDKDDFLISMQRIKNRSNENNNLLQDIIRNLKNIENKKIAISNIHGLELHDADDLLYCESDINYTNIYFVNGSSVLLSKTLKSIEESLPREIFVRVHNSAIVNIHHVKKIVREGGGYLVLTNGKAITISKSRKEALFNMFNKL
jgi:two-component system LytT family response regulator